MSPLYVYAVLAEPPADPLPAGWTGARLRLVSCGGVLAAVEDVSGAPALDPDSLRAHDRTVRRLAAKGVPLLPARFGSLSAGEAALCASLEPRVGPLRAAIEAVRGCDQMTVRIWHREASGIDEAAEDFSGPPPSPDAPAGGPGTRFLAARRARWLTGEKPPEVRRILEALAAHTRSERVEWHARPPLVASAFHLVPSAAVEDYRAALAEAAGREPRLRVSVTGPWPPYAFGPDELS